MKIKSLLLSAAVLFTAQVNAQSWVEDSAVVGPGYGNDVFYSLKNGTVKTEANNNWHLAFQVAPAPSQYNNASVMANHVRGNVRVFTAHAYAPTAFATFNAADTTAVATIDNELINSDETWNLGAFSRNNDPNDMLNFGWGNYNTTTHVVTGDSLYLVKVGGTFYKLWIQNFISDPADSMQWNFRIANVDGSEDTTVRIYRGSTFSDRLFAYYNILTKTALDREPARNTWDILFTRYKEYLQGAPGVPYYSVTGVLSNFDVTVKEINDMPADSITLDTLSMTFTEKISEIGSDWKMFDMSVPPGTWIIEDSLSYFVKTLHTDEYYQIMFTGFSGTSTGVANFKKRLVGTIPTSIVGVNATASANFGLVPNPAANTATVMIDATEAAGETRVLVTDLTGRVVYNTTVQVKQGINAYNLNVANLTSGTYIVSLSNSSWKAAQKLMVQH